MKSPPSKGCDRLGWQEFPSPPETGESGASFPFARCMWKIEPKKKKKITVWLHFSKCCLASSVPSLQEGCSLSLMHIVRGWLAAACLWDSALTHETQKPEGMGSRREPAPQPSGSWQRPALRVHPNRGNQCARFLYESSVSLSSWPCPSLPTQIIFPLKCFFQQFLIFLEETEVKWERDKNSDFGEGLR